MKVIVRADPHEADIFHTSGTIKQWIAEFAELAPCNKLIAISIMVAAASPLLGLVGEDNGGIYLYGASRTGKTSLLLIACSFWGGNLSRGGARAFMNSFRGTSNAQEAISLRHNDSGIFIDELGQADPRDLTNLFYLLGAGLTKSRMDRGGGLKAAKPFRGFASVTGEYTIEEFAARVGLKVPAGISMRFPALYADEGAGMGVFRTTHDRGTSAQVVQRIREVTATCFGAPARAYLKFLTDRLASDSDFCGHLRSEITRISGAMTKGLNDPGAQVLSVSRRFALLAVAGNLATEAGCTGWGIEPDTGETIAEWAARECFQSWITARGGTASQEDGDAVHQLREFVSKRGSSNFEDWRERGEAEVDNATPPAARFKVVNRAGWRRWVQVKEGDDLNFQWEYLLSVDGMREALKGCEFKSALKACVRYGLIIPGAKDVSHSIRVPGEARQRLYRVRAAAISATLRQPVAADSDTSEID